MIIPCWDVDVRRHKYYFGLVHRNVEAGEYELALPLAGEGLWKEFGGCWGSVFDCETVLGRTSEEGDVLEPNRKLGQEV